MVRENAAAKAKRYLGEGRVILVHVSQGKVSARVRGDGAVWDVTFMNGQWVCTCPARSRCSHLIATGLVVAPAEVGL
jgi:uncharacterized Zn finger protein